MPIIDPGHHNDVLNRRVQRIEPLPFTLGGLRVVPRLHEHANVLHLCLARIGCEHSIGDFNDGELIASMLSSHDVPIAQHAAEFAA